MLEGKWNKKTDGQDSWLVKKLGHIKRSNAKDFLNRTCTPQAEWRSDSIDSEIPETIKNYCEQKPQYDSMLDA